MPRRETNVAAGTPNDFPLLGRELRRRSMALFRNPRLFIGLLMNIAFGGWAIWLELLTIRLRIAKHDVESLLSAIVTFFPAIAGTTFVQAYCEDREENNLMGIPLVVLLVSLAPAVYFAFEEPGIGGLPLRLIEMAILCIVVMWFWLIVNADAAMYRGAPDAATGGNPRNSLAGDLDGLEG